MELNNNNRNIVSEDDLKHFSELELQAELSGHLQWANEFINKYNQ